MNTTEIVNVSIGLSATPASQATFTVPLLLVDHADIPYDRRYNIVTRSSYTTDLTASSTAYNWCAALWGQNYNPAEAYIGRWISANAAPYLYFPTYTSMLASWTAVTDGSLKLVDNTTPTPLSNTLTGMNFSACTSIADVCTAITAKLAAATPGIVGIATFTCVLDKMDRIQIRSSQTGASAKTISTAAAGSGTDLRTALLGTGISIAGVDTEAQGTALSAILEKDNTPFIICQRGGTVNQVKALSTAVNALDKILLLVCNDTTAPTSGVADFPYAIEALGHQKTHMTYTEHTSQHPDAAICGEIMPRTEATTSFALTPFSGLSESGLNGDGTTVEPLTATEIAYLEGKGCDFLINPAGSVHLRNGLAAGGNEMRVMIGKSFMAAKITEDIYGYLIANDVVTFSDSDIQAIKSIIVHWADIMVDRKVLDADYTITMPSADDFTRAQKATHTLTLSDVFSANVQSAVNDMVITMSFTV